jgi:endonuclease IV
MLTNVTDIQLNASSMDQSKPIIDQAERFLDILDEYQKKLGNPTVELGEISPIVNEMAAQKENLMPVLESMSDGDELKEILNRSLVTSSIEIYRFNKGYYNTQG